jgi:uncharacterized membrane protein YdbT with pleckstrin-like domain
MNYLQKTLLQDEKILYYTGPHIIIFFPAILWVVVSLVFFSAANFFIAIKLFGISIPGLLGNVSLVIALLYGFISYITYISSEYGITNKRVLMKIGFIRRNSLEIILHKIESIYVQQSILGRILNYGTIVIAGTGGSKDPFPYIPDPLVFRRKVQEQIENMEHAEKTGKHD